MVLTIDPTPILKLNKDFNGNTMFMKRDDLIPFSFGGNKARKAQHFFREMESQKCNWAVTYGSSSSNHCRIISNLAASKGLKCTIISPTENHKTTYNRQMMELFGAKIIYCNVTDVKETIVKILHNLTEKGKKPYFIPGGGHGNLGTKAYVEAYEEIRAFELEKNVHFDIIFHTSGTGTTQAGLICGQLIYGDQRQIIGISNARKNPYGGDVVLSSVNAYLKNVNKAGIEREAINFIDDYVLAGYGSFNNEIIEVGKKVLLNNGIPLDNTYTAKGFWGMEEYIKENQITGKNILFIHTGGTPLFFDDLEGLKK